ncbi:hypothetical protein EC988_006706 [Linderina pennispora]|nr:hypothetical protein EC988_006706 [Linderina pennispora]
MVQKQHLPLLGRSRMGSVGSMCPSASRTAPSTSGFGLGVSNADSLSNTEPAQRVSSVPSSNFATAALAAMAQADDRRSPEHIPRYIRRQQHQPSIVVQTSYVPQRPGGIDRSTEASRKRALTAPSLLESPMAKRPRYIGTEPTLHSSDEESANPQSPLALRTPLASRVSMPGVSPVSSLRSSLASGRGPPQPRLNHTDSAICQSKDAQQGSGGSPSISTAQHLPKRTHSQASRSPCSAHSSGSESRDRVRPKSATPSSPSLVSNVSSDALLPPISPTDD